MLIEFEVGNFLSFKDPVRLSMVASTTDKEQLDTNTFEVGRYRLLKCAAIYGANASGKSNLLAALNFMSDFVENSSRESTAKDEIKVVPFKFDYSTENAPSRFETTFLIENIHYRYGFEVTSKQVVNEWLFCSEKTKEVPLFLRTIDGIDVRERFSEGFGLESKTRDNALFLSVVAQFNGKLSIQISVSFQRLIFFQGLYNKSHHYTAKKMFNKEDFERVLSFVREADLGIESIHVAVKKSQSIADAVSQDTHSGYSISTVHQKYRDGKKDGFVQMDFLSEESEGTKKLFYFAGLLFDCITFGFDVCFDELDAKLHPLLTRAIVRMFNSASNSKNSQLIFTTHDTNLLQFGDLRRDQIWFTEKDQAGATDLYSLAEFKVKGGGKVRKDAAYEKNYIQGRYGAIPFLGDFGSLLKRQEENE